MSVKSVEGDIITTTEKSILLAIDGDHDNTIWIPRSVIEESEDDLEGAIEDTSLLVASWWYDKNKKELE